MKKGFTFVELAIVLVIIGLVMGMALKGRSLIESSRLRGEVRKVEKIRTVLAARMTMGQGGLNVLPLKSGEFDLETIALEGGLIPADIVIGGVDNLKLKICKRVSAKSAGHIIMDNETVGLRLCLVLTNFPARVMCSIESMLDDSDNSTGDGRSEFPITRNDVCEALGASFAEHFHYIIY